jgi:hypothetical protein
MIGENSTEYGLWQPETTSGEISSNGFGTAYGCCSGSGSVSGKM